MKTPNNLIVQVGTQGECALRASPEAAVHAINCHDDLVEALEEILDGIGFLAGGDHELEAVGITDPTRQASIRAALAKAKGGAS